MSPKNPLDLLHQTCERLLNECADRNRKPLKFRFIEIDSMDHNCNYNQRNKMNTSVNDLDKINTFTIDNQNDPSKCSNEILDYSMKQMKYPYYTSNTSSSLCSTTSSTLHNSFTTYPFSCFTSSAFKLSNLPSNSLNDILISLQQGLINPDTLLLPSTSSNVHTTQQQSISSYVIPTTQTLKQDNPTNETYFEYLKLLTNFLSYLSLLKCLNTSNTTDCSNILNGNISGTSEEESNL
ncbi:unnamed protein product [Schistosoma margrebowiei]|uniref:Uncharacterized protein n=1 Tax=Schistosoma margrebowiei TaxID=48269 RepID=A0AA85AJZ0_9TREM|nr:unnamed protein product [Schistosoma margrebowiei]